MAVMYDGLLHQKFEFFYFVIYLIFVINVCQQFSDAPDLKT